MRAILTLSSFFSFVCCTEIEMKKTSRYDEHKRELHIRLILVTSRLRWLTSCFCVIGDLYERLVMKLRLPGSPQSNRSHDDNFISLWNRLNFYYYENGNLIWWSAYETNDIYIDFLNRCHASKRINYIDVYSGRADTKLAFTLLVKKTMKSANWIFEIPSRLHRLHKK